jgi:hypothetical protein
VILTLERLKQEDHECKADMGYVVRLTQKPREKRNDFTAFVTMADRKFGGVSPGLSRD